MRRINMMKTDGDKMRNSPNTIASWRLSCCACGSGPWGYDAILILKTDLIYTIRDMPQTPELTSIFWVPNRFATLRPTCLYKHRSQTRIEHPTGRQKKNISTVEWNRFRFYRPRRSRTNQQLGHRRFEAAGNAKSQLLCMPQRAFL